MCHYMQSFRDDKHGVGKSPQVAPVLPRLFSCSVVQRGILGVLPYSFIMVLSSKLKSVNKGVEEGKELQGFFYFQQIKELYD